MITQEQVKEFAGRYKINESIVLREFVQITFLKELYEQKFSEKIFFKGGTAIRLLYGGKRFSEDLDFTVNLPEKEFTARINSLFKSLNKKYPFEFKERKTLAGKTYLLTASHPFFKNKIFVKLDFSLRENVLQPVKNILKTEYPIVFGGFVRSLSKDEIIAEKIRAILSRDKPRDLYDLWILQELGGKLDVTMINRKLEYYGEIFNIRILKKRLESFSKDYFIKDLRPFVPINERQKLGEMFDYIVAYLAKNLS
ncbi:nucleotidyl transferase AbiEii/AbiGii toxin family protein [Candidatus Dojkabacteria bacterium]|nr:nucleotidyl transferase AbiEii/AbiGii toxin family protein [Candidatus Dojkabacteria bacterium]